MSLTFLSDPRITLVQFTRVLHRAASPATVAAGEMWTVVTRAGIDPGVMLAFFKKESSFGTDRRWAGRKADGSTTHNIGNIVSTLAWRRAGGATHGRFRDYPSWQAGTADWCQLIKSGYVARGLTTVRAALPVYAPASDGNNPAAYADQVEALVARWRAEEQRALGARRRMQVIDPCSTDPRDNFAAVRQGPGVHYPIALGGTARLEPGDIVQVDQIRADGWAHLASSLGFVSRKLLKDVE
ncbi:MAG TPA: hypothetical protein VFS21_29795 [Roseiflexaceae bacterium]|nr:hypothetical protein [Roseiflexaceae bacterium]